MVSGAETAWLVEACGARVREFYATLGVTLPAQGGDASVRCFANPDAHSHDDRSASCSVSLATGLWKCHGCGEQGNAYRAALATGHSERDAARLARDHGLFIEKQPAPALVERGRLQAWHRQLVSNVALLDRLRVLRGWNSAAIRHLRLGFDGERIVFPIRDGKAKLVGVVRYQPNPAKRDQAKTLALPGSKRELFPAPESVPVGRPLFLVEGEPDAVAVWSTGHPAVAIPGTSSWRSQWAQRLFGRQVIVLCDCDRQGRELARKVAADVPNCVVVDVDPARDDGYDIGDLIREASADGGLGQASRVLSRLARREAVCRSVGSSR